MCCFSGPVAVSGTNIFARHLGARQLLVYDMRYATDADVAMILPLPVPPGTGEKAVRFIDLSGYPKLFEDLHAALEMPTRGGSFGELAAATDSLLEVHDVGSFDASFVPTRRDFSRLDERFRLPDRVWDALPLYADWGFAVFKLKPSAFAEGSNEVTPLMSGSVRPPRGPVVPAPQLHPMAFEFPTRAPDQVFFPTVHVHDGNVREYANFDHWLFLQLPEGQEPQSTVSDRFAPAERDVDSVCDIRRSQGLLARGEPLYALRYAGEALNEDIWAPIVRAR